MSVPRASPASSPTGRFRHRPPASSRYVPPAVRNPAASGTSPMMYAPAWNSRVSTYPTTMASRAAGGSSRAVRTGSNRPLGR